ncbi:MAG: hypothetical protein J6K55_12280 [Clostridia bacterium]|nr:hypothetical protein [Clostridia bacterium]
MEPKTVITKLHAIADYIRGARIPIGEKEAIERLLGCAAMLDDMAEELKQNEADNQ